MKSLKIASFSILLLIAPLAVQAQSAAVMSKLLKKSMKSTLKSQIPIPGLDLAKSGAKGAALAEAVNSGVGTALKSAKKLGLFSLDGFDAGQLAKIAGSDSPFTDILSLKGNNVYKEFSNLIGDGMKSAGAADLIGNMTGVSGFEMPSGGAEGFTRSMTDNVLGSLDKAGAAQLKNLKI
jgi:hypothetical protein